MTTSGSEIDARRDADTKKAALLAAAAKETQDAATPTDGNVNFQPSSSFG